MIDRSTSQRTFTGARVDRSSALAALQRKCVLSLATSVGGTGGGKYGRWGWGWSHYSEKSAV
eukprot:752396-Hanusia_phi.AAC.5